MITYEYNGVKLPPLKKLTGYNYALICSVTGKIFFSHILMLTTQPYKVLNGEICFDTAGKYQVYVATQNSTEWSEGSIEITSEGANTTYASIDKSATFLWCNENITNYDSDEVKYTATQPVEFFSAAKPVITINLPNSKYYNQNDENAEALKIGASASDTDNGAVLSYQWYCDGKEIEGATSNSYTPPVDQMGEWKYWCKVTNTYQEHTAFVNSNVVLVTIVEALKPINEEFLLGWKIGRIIAMLRGQVEPTIPIINDMYLYGTPAKIMATYNSIELPDIEEVWVAMGKESFPYATIFEDNTLYISNKKAQHGISSNNITFFSPTAFARYKIENDEWIMDGSIVEGSFSTTSKAIWSNEAILNDDGSTYLFGSDPVRTRIGGNIALRTSSEEEELKSTMYFYGVQSDSGSIGLRSGAAVTKYDGVVLPMLPDDITDDAYITYSSEKYWLFAGTTTVSESGVSLGLSPKYELQDNEWVATTAANGAGTVIWANFDVYYDNSIESLANTIYLAKSEPITVIKDIIGYAYYNNDSSTVPRILPQLPEYDSETYPYAIMEYLDNDDWDGDGALAHFRATNTPWTYYGTGGFYPMSTTSAGIEGERLECFISINSLEEGWNEPIYGEYRGHIGNDGVTNMSWTNHTINQYSGSWIVNSWKKSPDLIPVYEVYSSDNNSETITYYNGAVLNKLPTIAGYENVVIGEADGSYFALFSPVPITVGAQNHVSSFFDDVVCYKYSDEEWVSGSVYAATVFWTNHKVYYANSLEDIGGTLYMSAFNPISVSKVVGYIDNIPIYEVKNEF